MTQKSTSCFQFLLCLPPSANSGPSYSGNIRHRMRHCGFCPLSSPLLLVLLWPGVVWPFSSVDGPLPNMFSMSLIHKNSATLLLIKAKLGRATCQWHAQVSFSTCCLEFILFQRNWEGLGKREGERIVFLVTNISL